MKLKADLHLHTNLDPVDGMSARNIVKHSPEQLFALARSKGFKVLALTHHESLIYDTGLAKRAKKYDITLIPALEATIEGSHVIILNPLRSSYTTFAQLAQERAQNKHSFVYAPHPFYPGGTALKSKLEKHIDLFDGIEYCHFYFSFFNRWNKRAVAIAQKYHKTIVGTSDAHHLENIGVTYSVIDSASRSVNDIIASLKRPQNVELVTKPASFTYAAVVLSNMARTLAYFAWMR